MTNHERVRKKLDLLCAWLKPFAEREPKSRCSDSWQEEARRSLKDWRVQFPVDSEYEIPFT